MKRILFLAALAGFAAVAVAQEDPDRRKNAAALFNDGLRAETQPPVNLQVALQKYAKAIAVAEKEGNKDVGARATARAAICNEKLEPENINEALAKWKDCAEKFGDHETYGARAKEKTVLKGVDLYLEKLHAQLDAWRVLNTRLPSELTEKKTATLEKIKAVAADKEAVPGLIWGLGHPDEVIRDFSGGYLAEVIDEPGIASVVEKLGDANPVRQAGASNAFQKIFKKYNDAAALDQRAANLDRDITVPLDKGTGKPQAMIDKLKAEAEKMRKMASDIRHNIPSSIGQSSAIQNALAGIIGNESAHPQGRREAASALNWIGQISGPLAEALVKGMDSKDRNVREACCRAAGGVNTAISADKHKLADRLMKAVMDEPAKGESRETADWANDEAVRQAACEALEQIALVKTLPALIEALDDNDTRVRHAAFRALKEITERDFVYEKDDKGVDKTYEPDKPLAERQKAKAKYDEWWTQTKGVVVLVERFWKFQSRSTEANAVRLFDRDLFLKEVESRKWVSNDAKADMDRAVRIVDEFQKAKDVFTQDAEDLGGEALDNLLPFIGGETEKEPRGNPATRYFAAEACARIIAKHNPGGGVEKIKEKLLAGDTPAKKAGGALALGFLPKDKVGDAEREALQVRGLGAAEPEVKEAAAKALGKVGNDQSAASLTAAATDGASLDVQLAALRALSTLKPKNPDTVKALSDLVADEPDQAGGSSKKSRDKYVREYGVDALGNISDPAAMSALLRSCRDEMKNVREAARIAVQKIYAADAKASTDACIAVLKDERKKVDDRSGAALALGHMADPAGSKELIDRLIDPKPPRLLKDQDAGVRIKVCEAFGSMGAKGKTKEIANALWSALGDENEPQAVREAAYKGLKGVFDVDPDAETSPDKDKKFNYADKKEDRDAAIKKWGTLVQGVN